MTKEHGGARPGSGRPHVNGTPAGHMPDDPSVKVTVTLPRSSFELMRELGDGNVSKGVRCAVDFYREQNG